ncbi:hypothetical protein HDE_12914 [Halotydeus destructor]|nr:hypothetical protein HDE_12914 [Halotydeus destructor]
MSESVTTPLPVDSRSAKRDGSPRRDVGAKKPRLNDVIRYDSAPRPRQLIAGSPEFTNERSSRKYHGRPMSDEERELRSKNIGFEDIQEDTRNSELWAQIQLTLQNLVKNEKTTDLKNTLTKYAPTYAQPGDVYFYVSEISPEEAQRLTNVTTMISMRERYDHIITDGFGFNLSTQEGKMDMRVATLYYRPKAHETQGYAEHRNPKKVIYELKDTYNAPRSAIAIHYLYDMVLIGNNCQGKKKNKVTLKKTRHAIEGALVLDPTIKPKILAESITHTALADIRRNADMPIAEQEKRLINMDQVNHQKRKQRQRLEIEKDEIHSLFELCVQTRAPMIYHFKLWPEMVIVFACPKSIVLTNHLLDCMSKYPEAKFSLSYDTSFTFGRYFLSALVGRNFLVEGNPIYPVLLMLHANRRKEVHADLFNTFMTCCGSKFKPIQEKVPITLDREYAMSAALKHYFPAAKPTFCGNHLLANFKEYLRKHSREMSPETRNQIKSLFRETLRSQTEAIFGENVKRMLKKAPKRVRQLYEKNIAESMKSSAAYAVKQYPIFNDEKTGTSKFATNNAAESYNRTARTLKISSTTRVDVILLKLYYESSTQNFQFASAFMKRTNLRNYKLSTEYLSELQLRSLAEKMTEELPMEIIELRDLTTTIRRELKESLEDVRQHEDDSSLDGEKRKRIFTPREGQVILASQIIEEGNVYVPKIGTKFVVQQFDDEPVRGCFIVSNFRSHLKELVQWSLKVKRYVCTCGTLSHCAHILALKLFLGQKQAKYDEAERRPALIQQGVMTRARMRGAKLAPPKDNNPNLNRVVYDSQRSALGPGSSEVSFKSAVEELPAQTSDPNDETIVDEAYKDRTVGNSFLATQVESPVANEAIRRYDQMPYPVLPVDSQRKTMSLEHQAVISTQAPVSAEVNRKPLKLKLKLKPLIVPRRSTDGEDSTESPDPENLKLNSDLDESETGSHSDRTQADSDSDRTPEYVSNYREFLAPAAQPESPAETRGALPSMSDAMLESFFGKLESPIADESTEAKLSKAGLTSTPQQTSKTRLARSGTGMNSFENKLRAFSIERNDTLEKGREASGQSGLDPGSSLYISQNFELSDLQQNSLKKQSAATQCKPLRNASADVSIVNPAPRMQTMITDPIPLPRVNDDSDVVLSETMNSQEKGVPKNREIVFKRNGQPSRPEPIPIPRGLANTDGEVFLLARNTKSFEAAEGLMARFSTEMKAGFETNSFVDSLVPGAWIFASLVENFARILNFSLQLRDSEKEVFETITATVTVATEVVSMPLSDGWILTKHLRDASFVKEFSKTMPATKAAAVLFYLSGTSSKDPKARGSHFSTIFILFNSKEIVLFDSVAKGFIESAHSVVFQVAKRYVFFSMALVGILPDFAEWSFTVSSDTPHQGNFHDCGLMSMITYYSFATGNDTLELCSDESERDVTSELARILVARAVIEESQNADDFFETEDAFLLDFMQNNVIHDRFKHKAPSTWRYIYDMMEKSIPLKDHLVVTPKNKPLRKRMATLLRDEVRGGPTWKIECYDKCKEGSSYKSTLYRCVACRRWFHCECVFEKLGEDFQDTIFHCGCIRKHQLYTFLPENLVKETFPADV